MEKRVFLIVLDSFGIGAEPDAAAFGDEGTNTLGAIAGHPNFNCPNLKTIIFKGTRAQWEAIEKESYPY